MFKIDKNVPMPNLGPRSLKYNWDKMEIGDSVFVPESVWPEGKTPENMRQTIYNAARKYGAPKGIMYKSLIVTETQDNPDFRPYYVDGIEKFPGDTPAKIDVTGIRTWMLSGPVAKEAAPVEELTRTDEGDQTRDPQV